MRREDALIRLGNISSTTLAKYTAMGYLHPTKDKVDLVFDEDEVERFAGIYKLKSPLTRNKILYLIPDTDSHYILEESYRRRSIVPIEYVEDLDMTFEDLIKGLVKNDFVEVVLSPEKFTDFELKMIHLVAYQNMIMIKERSL